MTIPPSGHPALKMSCEGKGPVSPIPSHYSAASNSPPVSPLSCSSRSSRGSRSVGGRSSRSGSSAPPASPVSHVSSSGCSSYSRDDPYDGDTSIDDMKKDIDVYRQQGANMRALSLLNEAVVGQPSTSWQQPKLSSMMCGGHAALLKYCETAQQDKVVAKARRMVPRRRMEHLAESTRKPRELTPEDVLDPETVPGMKCQVDLDREKRAKDKALRLLNEGFMF